MADEQPHANSYQFSRLPLDARWDERALFFLNELPAWLIIIGLLVFLVTIWLRTASVQIESYIGQALAALLTAVVTNRNRRANVDNSVKAEVIKTPSMDSANITADSVNMEKPSKG